MFGKRSPDQPSQSQSMSGNQITNSPINMTQAGRDATSTQSANLSQQQQGITGAEVVNLLTELEAMVKATDLPPDRQEEALDYLKPAKREAAKENPDKNLIAQNLKQVGDALESANKATEAGKNLWQKGQEVFKAIAPWLGVASKFIGF